MRIQRFRAAVGDRVPEVGAIAAPLFDGATPYGAVSISGPAERWDLRRMRAAAPLLTAVTDEMSTLLKPAPAVAGDAAGSPRWAGDAAGPHVGSARAAR